ncbi:MAG: hypothetical protein QM778_34265 [Myxococcales bacterium]
MGVARAQPAPSVLLLEHPGLRPDLCGALRIQLSGLAQVRCERETAAVALPARIGAAAERVRGGKAKLGVFLERDPDPGFVRMYIVGSEGDQAVLAVEKIEDRPDADVDRSLALEVAAAFEAVARVEAARQEGRPAEGTPGPAPTPLGGVLAPPGAPAPTVRADQAPAAGAGQEVSAREHGWALFVDVGGGFRVDAAVQGLVSADLGFSRVSARTRLDLGVGFELGTRYQRSQDQTQVHAWERGPQVTARLLRRWTRIELGGELVIGCPLLSAEGIARDGTRGEKLLALPSLGFGLDFRVRLVSTAFLRLSPRLDVPLVHQSLEVDDVQVMDFPPLGVTVPLSLIFYLPLQAGGT